LLKILLALNSIDKDSKINLSNISIKTDKYDVHVTLFAPPPNSLIYLRLPQPSLYQYSTLLVFNMPYSTLTYHHFQQQNTFLKLRKRKERRPAALFSQDMIFNVGRVLSIH
jgi:hypothetical protein